MQAKTPPNVIRGTVLTIHYFVVKADEAEIIRNAIPQEIALVAAATHLGHRTATKVGYKPDDVSKYYVQLIDGGPISFLYDVLDPEHSNSYIASVRITDLQVPTEQLTAEARIYLRSE
jgi:hypothetical protein